MAEQHNQEQARAAHEAAPSAVRTVDDEAQVMVDQFGHAGEFVRGDFVTRAQAKERGFDFDWAVNMGTLRKLTEAEMRSRPHTHGLDALGNVDEDFGRTMRFHAGMPEELPRTVTTAESFPEPKEWAKPALPMVDGPPPARPVEVVGSAAEAQHAADYQQAVVHTEAGQPAFATPEEQEAMKAEGDESGEAHARRGGRRG
jgi:hypothetical protein